MNKEKSIVELKKMCKKYNITGYSKLNKSDLIKIINKKMKGGNFDESYIKDAYAENYKSKFRNINSRKEMADSPNFFLAFLKDNVNLFNEKSNNFYRNMIKNTEVRRGWKPEITVKCSLPNGELIEKTGEVYSEHKSGGFIIIYCK
jgi:hypothetical protein